MKKIIIYIVTFVLLTSLVLAVGITTDKDEYSSNETVNISITDCTKTSIVQIFNPSNALTDIKGGSDDWNTSYNTLSNSAKGKYKILASCTNGQTEKFFCVNSSGCLTTPPTTTTGGGGGGGGHCTSDWGCTYWSYCNSSLKQARTCVDKNNCQSQKEEIQDCEQCQESWVCSLWSECYLGTNTRTCVDEHYCKTSLLKPSLQKSCQIEIPSGPPPVQVSAQLPPPSYAEMPLPPVPQQPAKSTFQKLWENYNIYAIAGMSGLILIIITIIIVVHFIQANKPASNLDELKEWIKKEKEMGTSEEEMRKTLSQTAWKKEEIDQEINELQQKKP